jgi:hypothetical protein
VLLLLLCWQATACTALFTYDSKPATAPSYSAAAFCCCYTASMAVTAPDCCYLQRLEDVLAEAEDDVGGAHGCQLLGASTLRQQQQQQQPPPEHLGYNCMNNMLPTAWLHSMFVRREHTEGADIQLLECSSVSSQATELRSAKAAVKLPGL